MKKYFMQLRTLTGPLLIIAIAFASWSFRTQLFPRSREVTQSAENLSTGKTEKQTVLEVGGRARKNLGIIVAQAKLQSQWRSVSIPGEIADQPGLSDRGVTAPAVGVVGSIHVFPGDTVRPGEALFTLQLFSEYLQATQTQLFKAIRETAIVNTEIDRLSNAVNTGAIPPSRLIESRGELNRQAALIQAARQELLNRGLSPEQVANVETGSFVSSIEVKAPPRRQQREIASTIGTASNLTIVPSDPQENDGDFYYEVQDLSVELGQQVQAGQLLVNLSNHQNLFVVGHAFKREAASLERAVQEQRPIEIEFSEDQTDGWQKLDQSFEIRHLANTIDKNNRTFDFFIPLSNQSRSIERQGRALKVWRYRPGQRAKIHLPVEEFKNVFVLPTEGVVRDGADAYVFRQNGDLFKQLAVRVLHEDRRYVVIANEGSIAIGSYLAQNAAASLNRILKAQTASGEQPGLHVHPDGTTHAAH